MHPSFILVVFSHLAAVAQSHFVLESPTSLGYNDAKEATGPCDTFGLTARTNVTNWPLGGYPISLWTTHPKVTFVFRTALLSDTNSWVNFIPPIT